ncbi:MAG: prepilin-type N-terminal cleavage/methylation domain-containing protein [Parcubacteria group bacterium]|nr:prepilin-type N-terminal cleavage/methylation domain-containing protein [Parcubacteria group bacterium]
MRIRPREKGFTLMEMIIGLALILLTLTGIVAISNTYLINQQLDNAAESALEEIRRAQGDAIAATGDSGHGIKIIGSTLIRFRGNSFATRNAIYDVDSTFPPFLSFGGNDEIIFPKLSPAPVAAASLTISNNIELYTISTSLYGNISLSRGSVAP